MKPKQMTFYVDDQGRYWNIVHQYGYSEVPKKWIEEWEAKGIKIILHEKKAGIDNA